MSRSGLRSGSFNQMLALLLASACAVSGGCSKSLPLAAPAAPLSQPTRLCAEGETPPTCRSARGVEELLAGDLKIVGMADPPSGSQGAKLLTLRGKLRGREVVFRAKWRPQSSDDLINESRKELAAYAVQ